MPPFVGKAMLTVGISPTVRYVTIQQEPEPPLGALVGLPPESVKTNKEIWLVNIAAFNAAICEEVSKGLVSAEYGVQGCNGSGPTPLRKPTYGFGSGFGASRGP